MKKVILCLLVSILGLGIQAQQALRDGSLVVSPEIHPDNTVTFRIIAPKAVKVQVTGDFLPPVKITTPNGGGYEIPGIADLVENDGVWEYTTPAPLAPELDKSLIHISEHTSRRAISYAD